MSNLTKKTEIDYGIHDGRIIVQTALENVKCPNNWIKKVKGRKVKGEESPYSKPAINDLRKKFKEALPEIEYLTEYASIVDPQLRFAQEIAKVLEQYPEKKEKFAKFIMNL